MGSVGLNFGSATSGAGFDVTATVNSILGIQQAIETPWQNQLTALHAQDTALTQLGTNLSSLTSSLQSLTDPLGILASKEGSSSNTNVLALSSADSTAVAGSHTIVVNSLASTSTDYSNSITNASDTLSGSLTVQVGSGTAQTITVGSSSNTLASLSAAINAAAIGVSASVITDASGSRLSIVSDTSGSAGQLTLTSSLTDATTATALSFTSGQSGADASLSVDGLNITEASNTVTGAIPGVTFQLLATSASPVQVQVTNNNTAVETAVANFVSSYNAVIGDINTQESNTASGAAEPLFGSPTLSLIQSQLQTSLFTGTASGSISSIAQLGISVNSDGTLSFDSSALDTTLNTSYADVAGFLQNASGFGQAFAATLNGLGTQAPSGAIYLLQQQNSTQEADLNTSITNENATIATERTTLTAELNQANQTLQAIPSELNSINEIYSAVTGYSKVTPG